MIGGGEKRKIEREKNIELTFSCKLILCAPLGLDSLAEFKELSCATSASLADNACSKEDVKSSIKLSL